MHEYPLFTTVAPQKSNSSFGSWVVKTSEIHFRFFWRKADALRFATEYNAAMAID